MITSVVDSRPFEMDHNGLTPSQPPLNTSPIIVDIQCFIDNYKEYILKEVCVIEEETGVLIMHHIVEPPYRKTLLMDNILRINYRTMKKCHGLTWECGDIPYHELNDKLTRCISNRSVVYVKGAEKKEYLKQYFVTDRSSTNIIDAYDIGCESLSSISVSPHVLRCKNHNSINTRCALTHCIALREWLQSSTKTNDDVSSGATTSSSSRSGTCFCSCFHNTTTATAASVGYDTVDGGI